MKRPLVVALATVTIAALTPSQAHADSGGAGNLAVSSPSCGTVLVNGPSGSHVVFADGTSYDLDDTTRSVTKRLPAGENLVGGYTPDAEGPFDEYHWLDVAPCGPSYPRIPAQGDLDGDGRADVIAVRASDGALFRYLMTSRGLATGVRVGSGWQHMRYLQRLDDLDRRQLYAVRDDGTLWRYDITPTGAVHSGTQIASGLQDYQDFAFGTPNERYSGVRRVLWAVRDGRRYRFWITRGALDEGFADQAVAAGTRTIALHEANGDNQADMATIRPDGSLWLDAGDTPFPYGDFDPNHPPHQVGHGWGQMRKVTSPGSFDGDALSDLMAVRDDGNLYVYLNKGGVWGPATKIGQNWNGMRLLA